VRRLIVNADDFGLTSGVNRGIIEAHTHGIVTSSTLMACGAKSQEAVDLASRAPQLSVGCHVLLVDASPVLDVQQVSSLAFVNSRPNSGPNFSHNSGTPKFRDSLVSFACLAVARRLNEDEIEAEITAQIRKLQAAGIQVSHLDSHKHTHMFPVVFRPMLRAAKKCGIRAVRNPFEPLFLAGTRNWKRRIQLGILRSFQESFREALGGAGMMTPNGCVGIVATGSLTLQTFRQLIENLPDGTWEFVTHPGYNDVELKNIKTRLRRSREDELAILTSTEVKELLKREQIELISYTEFGLSRKSSLEVPSPLSDD
jgi:hopanoid biosynthesis associated protein HpnK